MIRIQQFLQFCLSHNLFLRLYLYISYFYSYDLFKGFIKLINAGNKIKDESNATISMIVANIPNSKFGLKLEKISTKKPIPRVMLVPMMALPVVRIVVVRIVVSVLVSCVVSVILVGIVSFRFVSLRFD